MISSDAGAAPRVLKVSDPGNWGRKKRFRYGNRAAVNALFF